MYITLREVGADDARWVSFAFSDPALTLFQSPRWSRVVAATYEFEARVLLAFEGETLVAGMPFCHIDDFRGPRRVAFPFADNVEPLPVPLWPQFEAWIANDEYPWSVRTRCEPGELADQRREAAKHHAIELPQAVEETRALYHYKHLQNVKQAEKAGLTFRRLDGIEAINVFYALHSNVRKTKHGLLPQPYRFFETIRQEFFPDEGFVLVAEQGERVVSAMLFIACGSTLYYKFSASALDALLVRPNHFLITKSIEEAVRLGFRRMDLGISDTEGLIRFKDRIGGKSSDVFAAFYNTVAKTNAVREIESALGKLTSLLTAKELPLDAAQRGGDILYRFFT